MMAEWVKILIIAGAALALSLITFSLVTNGRRGWGWVFAGVFIIVALAILNVIGSLLKLVASSSGHRARSLGHYTGDSGWNMGWRPGRGGRAIGRW